MREESLKISQREERLSLKDGKKWLTFQKCNKNILGKLGWHIENIYFLGEMNLSFLWKYNCVYNK